MVLSDSEVYFCNSHPCRENICLPPQSSQIQLGIIKLVITEQNLIWISDPLALIATSRGFVQSEANSVDLYLYHF